MNDLSVFSANEFNSTRWINQIVDEMQSGENLEGYISSVGMKLHMAAQDYSEQLETAMMESMSTMPRMVSEINRLQEQLGSVQEEMKVISDHIHSVDDRSVAGVEELSKLDYIKTNMEKCRATLEEHARWSQLVREARTLLEGGGGELSETADRIQVMNNSLEILKKLPGHEERKETYETFRTTLLNALTPNIRKEINEMSMGTLQEYFYVYKKLNSANDFEVEYVKNRPINVLNFWNASYQPSSSSAATASFSEWFASYLGNITKFLTDEENNLLELFGEEHFLHVEILLLKEMLSPVKLQFQEKLKVSFAAGKGGNASLDEEKQLQITYECYLILDEFMKRIISLLLIKPVSTPSTSSSVHGSVRHYQNEKKAIFELFDLLFSSFLSYLFSSNLENEEKYFKSKISRCYQLLSFQKKAKSKNSPEFQLTTTNNAKDFFDNLSTNNNEDLDQLTTFMDSLSTVIDSFVQDCNERLSKSSMIMGGITIRQSSKILLNSLNSFLKLLIIKFIHFHIALGIEKSENIPTSSSSSGGGSAGSMNASVAAATAVLHPNATVTMNNSNDPFIASLYSAQEFQSLNFPEELKSVSKIAVSLHATTEYDWQNILLNLLKSFQVLGKFLKLLNLLEMNYRNSCLEIQRNLFQNDSFTNAFPNDLETIVRQSHSISFGQLYANFLLLNDSSASSANNIGELKSFLSTNSGINSIYLQSSIFSIVFPTIKKLKNRVGNSLITLSNSLPLKLMSNYSSDENIFQKSLNEEELENMRMNLLPQSSITQVGEHLLLWVQDLESFASSEALSDLQILKGEGYSILSTTVGWNVLKTVLDIQDVSFFFTFIFTLY
jgi:hypothetical protein